MHKSSFVRRPRCLRHLRADPGHPIEFEPSPEERAQVGALDVAHRDVQLPLCLPGAVDGHDVRVLGGSGGVGLPDEPFTKRRGLPVSPGRWLERSKQGSDASVAGCLDGGVDAQATLVELRHCTQDRALQLPEHVAELAPIGKCSRRCGG